MLRQVLFVDPVQRPSNAVHEAFRAQGISVTTLHDVEAALEEVAQVLPQLVLVDISMPRLVGFLRELRSTHDDLPVVLMCEPSLVEQAVGALSYGVTDYVLKPLRTHELLPKLMRLLDVQEAAAAESSGVASSFVQLADVRLYKAVQRFEFEYVSRTVAQFSGDKRAASKHLGISLSSLYRKLDLGASVG